MDQSQFPDAKNIKWGKENANDFEAEFKLDGKKVSANFSMKGAWLETETEFPVVDLPEAVVASINKKFGGWKIVGADKIELAVRLPEVVRAAIELQLDNLQRLPIEVHKRYGL